METLPTKCPTCGCLMAPMPFMRSATLVVRRKCHRKQCATRWQIVCKPHKIKQGFAHVMDFVEIKAAA